MASDRPTKCAKVHISTQISFWQCLLVIRYSVLVIGYSPNGLRTTNQVCQSSYFDPNIILTMSVGYSLFGVGYWLFAKRPQIDQPSVPKFIFWPKYHFKVHFDNVCWLFVIRCWLLVIRQMASDRPTKCAKVHISTQISFWQCLLVIRYSVLVIGYSPNGLRSTNQVCQSSYFDPNIILTMSVGYSLFGVGYWLFAKWPQIDQPSVPKFIFRPKYHFDNVCWLFVIRCWLLVIRQMASDRPTKCAKVHISTQISFWQCLLVIRYSVLVIGYSPNGLRSTNQVCQSSYFDPNIILTMSVGYSLFGVGYWLFAKWPQIDQPSVPKFIFRPKYHFDNVCWLFVIRCWLLVIRQKASDRPTKCAKVHISTQISFWQCLLVIRYSVLVIGYSPNGLRSTNQVCQSSYFDPNIILTMSVGYSLFGVGYCQSSYFDPNSQFWHFPFGYSHLVFGYSPYKCKTEMCQSSYFDPNSQFSQCLFLIGYSHLVFGYSPYNLQMQFRDVPKFIFRPQ